MIDLTPYLIRARDERAKPGYSLRHVQRETALVWCGRACVAAMAGMPGEAIEYAHEAIEHAALSGDDELLRELRAAMLVYGVRL